MDQGNATTGETEDIISQGLQSEEFSKGILHETTTSLIYLPVPEFEDILQYYQPNTNFLLPLLLWQVEKEVIKRGKKGNPILFQYYCFSLIEQCL